MKSQHSPSQNSAVKKVAGHDRRTGVAPRKSTFRRSREDIAVAEKGVYSHSHNRYSTAGDSKERKMNRAALVCTPLVPGKCFLGE